MQNNHNGMIPLNDMTIKSATQMVTMFQLPACIIRVSGEVIASNDAYTELVNTKNITLDVTHPFYPEYRKQLAASYLKALRGISRQCFAVFRNKDNQRVSAELYIFPIFQDTIIVALFVILQIVDERILSFDKSTDTIINQQEKNYETLLYEFSPFPILQIDQSGNIVKASPSVQELIGYEINDLKKNRNLLYRSLNHYDFNRLRVTLAQIFEGTIGYKRIGEVRFITKDKDEKWVNVTCYPVHSSGEQTVVEIILEDITRIKRLEYQLQQLSRFHIIGDLTKGFLHSFNNMINIMLNKAQWLLQITEKPSFQEGLKLIIKSAEESIQQIRRIEDFIGRDKFEDKSDINIVEAIEDAIEFAKIQFKVEEAQKRRSITIERRYFSLVSMYGDPHIFRDLLLATIFKVASVISTKGVVEVTLKRNSTLTIAMKAKKELSENKDEFAFISTIDLSKLAEQNHAKLLEEESLHEYSITIILPEDTVSPLPYKEQQIPQTKLRDMDICIVEDEPALQEIMYEVFDSLGNRVSVFNNADQAYDSFKINKFDIVIADYGLSGTTGLELLTKIKEQKEETITVLLTGWILNNIKAYKNVIDIYMHKPFKLDVLINEISNEISKRHTF
ncbi:MAG: response regulator [Spirochaetes bacterium]|nr:response regulator [Spirochaetota bacterium]